MIKHVHGLAPKSLLRIISGAPAAQRAAKRSPIPI